MATRKATKVVPSRKPDPAPVRHADIDMDDADVKAFVDEYMKDFDEYNAGLRMGWPRAMLTNRVRQVFWSVPVQQMLMERVDATPINELTTPARIVVRLLQEATSQANKGSTRVSALKALKEAYKVDGTKRAPGAGGVRGGVMYVPMMDPNDWEEVAAKQQAALTKVVKEPKETRK